MKYIRAQDSRVFSVSQLEPPCKKEDEGPWYLSVITTDGEQHTYARYYNESSAWGAYDAVMFFMEKNDYSMLKFKVGESGFPDGYEEARKSNPLSNEWAEYRKAKAASKAKDIETNPE